MKIQKCHLQAWTNPLSCSKSSDIEINASAAISSSLQRTFPLVVCLPTRAQQWLELLDVIRWINHEEVGLNYLVLSGIVWYVSVRPSAGKRWISCHRTEGLDDHGDKYIHFALSTRPNDILQAPGPQTSTKCPANFHSLRNQHLRMLNTGIQHHDTLSQHRRADLWYTGQQPSS